MENSCTDQKVIAIKDGWVAYSYNNGQHIGHMMKDLFLVGATKVASESEGFVAQETYEDIDGNIKYGAPIHIDSIVEGAGSGGTEPIAITYGYGVLFARILWPEGSVIIKKDCSVESFARSWNSSGTMEQKVLDRQFDLISRCNDRKAFSKKMLNSN